MPLRILHILDHSLPIHSGYAFRSDAIRREQEALGWETFWLTTPKQGEVFGPEETIDGKRYFRTTDQFESGPAAQMRATTRRLDTLLDQIRPDIIQAHSPVLNVLPALWLRRRYNIPVVYERRSSWEDAAATRGTSTVGGLRYRASRLMETIAFRQVDAITTICDGLRKDIVERGISKDKVTLIPNGVDPFAFQMKQERDHELAASLGLTDATVLGYAGSFSPYEGLELLIDAVGRLSVDRPRLKVLLVGAGGNEHELRARAASLGLNEAIVFAGRVEHSEMERYYSLIDILVYPRRATRLTDMVTPLKPLEAMAGGRLVLASDVGGHRELIRHQDNGFLFEADSADSLTQSIQTLLDSRSSWSAVTERARQFVESERTWAKCISAYCQVYQRLLRRPVGDALVKQ